MKRPEGFDAPTITPLANPQPAEKRLRVQKPDREQLTKRADGDARTLDVNLLEKSAGARGARAPRRTNLRSHKHDGGVSTVGSADEASAPAVNSERQARAAIRRAARQRRRYERAEMRRFTRRSRRRRIHLAVAGGVVLSMVALVAVAVFSPLLALRVIRVDGTSRLSAPAIIAAIDHQVGTPLALVDMKQMTGELAKFPLIRSFVTETVPPDTLIVHIVERQPIGSIGSEGAYSLVDPAGVEIERSTARIPGVPLIDTGGADVLSPSFTAAVEVLASMPESVLSKLDTISARTRDDVTITLVSGGARIIWGSADNSDYKGRVLAAALAKNFPGVTEYNVSAPGQLTYR